MQRAIEAAGIATVSVTLYRQVTAKLRVPRALSLRFPFGYPLGDAFDIDFQHRIIRHALEALEELREPGTIVDLPYRWEDYRRARDAGRPFPSAAHSPRQIDGRP